MTLRSLALLAGIALGALIAYAAPAFAGAPYQTPTTISCTTTNQACTAGTCAGAVPDSGTATGIALANVQGYTVTVCAPSEQTLQATGYAVVYHCKATGECPEVRGNRQAITVSGGKCEEFPAFVVPYLDNTADRMTWILSGVTVSPDDAGTATISICPQH